MKSKAQVSAPIELLVGVTMLAMVLIIGFFSFNNMCVNQYNQKIKASMAQFAGDMATVYRGGVGTEQPSYLDFSSLGCGEGEIDSVRLVQGSPNYCVKTVGSADCYVFAGVGRAIVNNAPQAEVSFVQPIHIPFDVPIMHDRDLSMYPDDPHVEEIIKMLSIQSSSSETGFSPATKYSWGPNLYSLKIKKVKVGSQVQIVISENS